MEVERPLEVSLQHKGADVTEVSESNTSSPTPPMIASDAMHPIDNSVSSTVSSNEPEQEPMDDMPDEGAPAVEEEIKPQSAAANTSVHDTPAVEPEPSISTEPSNPVDEKDIKVSVKQDEPMEVNGEPESLPDVEPVVVKSDEDSPMAGAVILAVDCLIDCYLK